MKAAVLHALGDVPRYEDFTDPIVGGNILVHMRTAALKNLDKAKAAGKHYSNYPVLPVVVGTDGVGLLEDGSPVYVSGLMGMMGERALVSEKNITHVPAGLDLGLAAALPNAVLGSALALTVRGQMQRGQHILINGATGVTGMAAVQIARHYGAGRITVTGRNHTMLERLRRLGADETVSLKSNEATVLDKLKNIQAQTPVDLVIDYLWGRPIELIILALRGAGMHSLECPVRIVTVGEMAGKDITLASGVLRSAPIELCGSGFGSLSQTVLEEFRLQTLPEMMHLALSGGLLLDIRKYPLSAIYDAWNAEAAPGERIVVEIA
jgi:NADPH:quinone reductase-like Zn-dependent oxidoreductase